MFKILWALGLTIVSSTVPAFYARGQLTEQFNDNGWISRGNWGGDVSSFRVVDDRLQLTAPESQEKVFLTSDRNIAHGTWAISVRLDFNPSGQNHLRIYLSADQQDLTQPLNGYFVMVGGPDDEISLYRQSGSSIQKILDGENDLTDLPVVDARLQITRSADGVWQLRHALDGAADLSDGGAVSDVVYLGGTYFGIVCVFTPTRSDKFFFDDLSLSGVPAPKPEVYDDAAYKDVVISEVMADPTPRVALPESAYVEIFNRGGKPFHTQGWTLSDGPTTAAIPSAVLAPGDYLLLVPATAAGAFAFVPNHHALGSFPAINNAGDRLILRNGKSVVIDSLNFQDSWYRDEDKKQGGWSLELIDPENLCGEEYNWVASTDPAGGTPGARNAVFANNPDLTGPLLKDVFPLSDRVLQIDFNENLAVEPVRPEQVDIQPAVGVAAVGFDSSPRSLLVQLQDLLTSGTRYTVTVRGIRDCHKNLATDAGAAAFGLPEVADSLDVILNELLFNPYPNGADFIELYNRSGKFLNVNGWGLGRINGGAPADVKAISGGNRLLPPGSYLVVTDDKDDIISRYPRADPAVMIGQPIPPMPDDAGSVVLVDGAGQVLDAVVYDKSMHSPLVTDAEGVSLERIHSTSPSPDRQNWNSASRQAGYATPGTTNSNGLPDPGVYADPVTVVPEIFQPLSGSPSFTQVQYQFEQTGYVGSIRILDRAGRPVKELANNDLLGASGFYRWDGDYDDGSRAGIGYYVVWFEVFDLQGVVKTYRKRVIVAAPF